MVGKRVGFIDEVRGFAILCMVVYHAMYDLNFIYNIPVPIFFDSWFYFIRDIFAGLFIFISGVACQFSHNNIKRGIQCFFFGMLITFVTGYKSNFPIIFGILHFLGISMILYGLFEKVFEKIPTFIGILVSVFIFIITYNIIYRTIGIPGILSIRLPDWLYSSNVMFPFGFVPYGFSSSDFFPLFPWFFLFLTGTFFGVYVKMGALPRFFYKTRIPALAFIGRYTIWVYLLHQPVLILIFSIIFGKRLF